ncbi:alpha/beta fold hydrolase [Nonomuraea jabiensis]|uniref:alpha/beta fold hydrolase n=1 Tax=Nonomuraea jabiensis TaxID=882448 RepID=UPI0036985037
MDGLDLQVASDSFRVICPDLPGYGGSAKPEGGHEQYAKRVTAATMVALMRHLGHEHFSLVGHDRGALVAFRAALDHPDAVDHISSRSSTTCPSG